MRILIVTPIVPRARTGNRVTALRWVRMLRGLGHRVRVASEYGGQPCDVLVALHARKSAPSVQRFRDAHPDRHIVLALTGTDLYDEIRTCPDARRSIELATRLVVLQPAGLAEFSEAVRVKTRVIIQSAERPLRPAAPDRSVFQVCVLAHLRPVKDPLRTAFAARLVPSSSKIQVVHLGNALDETLAEEALKEMAINPRYRWLGERPRAETLRTLASSRLMVLTSQLEGGANAVSEAIACSVPVIASRISGSIGVLGEEYPGYFPMGDTQALSDLLRHAETDAGFYESLTSWSERRAALVNPANERRAWQDLLRELGSGSSVISSPD
jgi:putative glycosyltransferase (TIGR04348 family)